MAWSWLALSQAHTARCWQLFQARPQGQKTQAQSTESNSAEKPGSSIMSKQNHQQMKRQPNSLSLEFEALGAAPSNISRS